MNYQAAPLHIKTSFGAPLDLKTLLNVALRNYVKYNSMGYTDFY